MHQSNDNGTNALKYYYDDLNRLSEVKSSTAPNCYGDPEFGWVCEEGQTQVLASSDYDSVGNRYVTQNDWYDVGNRIREFDGCTYANDTDGNVTSRTCGTDVTTFEWFADNKLKKVVRNGNSSWFYYDASGRIARIGGYGWKRFYWLGGNLLAQLNWNATSKDAEYSYYGADNLHAVRVGTTNYFAHSDGAGNVIALTDQSDVVKRTYEYGEWGELVGGTDNVNFFEKDRARFKGAMWDNVSGLYFMRNRWYEPESGRFMSEDPIGLAGGINPYTFAANNPITLRDPTGLAPCDGPGIHFDVFLFSFSLCFGSKSEVGDVDCDNVGANEIVCGKPAKVELTDPRGIIDDLGDVSDGFRDFVSACAVPYANVAINVLGDGVFAVASVQTGGAAVLAQAEVRNILFLTHREGRLSTIRSIDNYVGDAIAASGRMTRNRAEGFIASTALHAAGAAERPSGLVGALRSITPVIATNDALKYAQSSCGGR